MTPTPQQTTEDSGPLPDEPRELIAALFKRSAIDVVEAMGASGNEAYIPVLVDLVHYPISLQIWKAAFSSLAQITGEEGNDDSKWWAEWLGVRPEIQGPDGYAAWKGRLYATIDPDMGAFLHEGIQARIRIEGTSRLSSSHPECPRDGK